MMREVVLIDFNQGKYTRPVTKREKNLVRASQSPLGAKCQIYQSLQSIQRVFYLKRFSIHVKCWKQLKLAGFVLGVECMSLCCLQRKQEIGKVLLFFNLDHILPMVQSQASGY